MSLTIDGAPVDSTLRVPDYRSTLEKAEAATDIAMRERRALHRGRRESDMEIAILNTRLNLAGDLLRDAIKMIESGMHTEQELTALKMGVEVIGQ